MTTQTTPQPKEPTMNVRDLIAALQDHPMATTPDARPWDELNYWERKARREAIDKAASEALATTELDATTAPEGA